MILQSFQTQSAELLSTGQAQHAACSPNQIHFPAPFPPPLTPVQPLSPPSATPRHPDAASAKPCLSQLPPNPHATPVTPFRYPSPSRCCTSKALPKPVAFQTPLQPLSPPSARPRHPDAVPAKPCSSHSAPKPPCNPCLPLAPSLAIQMLHQQSPAQAIRPPNPRAIPVSPWPHPSPSRCCTSKALPKPVAFQTPLQPLSPPGPTPRHLDAATAKPCPSQSPTWPVEADCALRSQHTCMHSLLGSDGFGHACLPCFKAAQSNAHTSLNMSWKVEEEEVTGESHQLRPANKAVPIMATMSYVHEI